MSTPFPALTPIPTPARRRFTAFCTEKLPFVIFGLGVVVAASLWNQSTSPTLIAEAESVATEVRSAQEGMLTSLDVTLLQSVKAGQVIGRVRLADPKVLAASLGVVRAEIDLMRANLEPIIPAQRVALDAARLQLDWMHERVTLASLRVQLQQADAELQRLTPLREKSLVSEELFDTARHQRENISVQLAEQIKLVDALAPAASEFAARRAELTPRSATETLAAAVRVQDEKLKLTEAQLGAAELTAPIDGVVSTVHRRAGETIARGESVVTIAADRPARIIGFIRQPVLLEPTAGMKVELRTRNAARQVASTQITEVGRVMEPVSPTILALLNRTNSPELGLRIHIAVPAGFQLRPGEQVDVTVKD
jgi:multidrug resistance efflux pump